MRCGSQSCLLGEQPDRWSLRGQVNRKRFQANHILEHARATPSQLLVQRIQTQTRCIAHDCRPRPSRISRRRGARRRTQCCSARYKLSVEKSTSCMKSARTACQPRTLSPGFALERRPAARDPCGTTPATLAAGGPLAPSWWNAADCARCTAALSAVGWRRMRTWRTCSQRFTCDEWGMRWVMRTPPG